jgi:TetR/AcrR family transcriptional regulator, copper-responsive repressor
MVQKESKRPRGRPRGYDPDRAMEQAMAAFWDKGYAATSLDDISAATGMNRPSLYAAFGDKQAIYLGAIARYRAGPALHEALAGHARLRDSLRAAYRAALDIYLSGDQGARGCFVIGTAATEAVTNPRVRGELAGVLGDVDEAFEARIARARDEGELPPGAQPRKLAMLASAALHSLAVRARAGASRAELEGIADATVDLICGSAKSKASAKQIR